MAIMGVAKAVYGVDDLDTCVHAVGSKTHDKDAKREPDPTRTITGAQSGARKRYPTPVSVRI